MGTTINVTSNGQTGGVTAGVVGGDGLRARILGGGGVTHYTTVIDRGYLPRLLVMLESMRLHCRPFMLHVLCWDIEAYRALFILEGEADDVAVSLYEPRRFLRPSGRPRSDVELMWTARAMFTAQAVLTFGEAIQLDADQMFWSSPNEAISDLTRGLSPVGVTPHGFASADRGLPGPTLESHRKYGLYNAGFVYLARPELAGWWAKKAAEWCYSSPEIVDGAPLYADQVYLERLLGVHDGGVIRRAVNVGPWAVHTREWSLREIVVAPVGPPSPDEFAIPLCSRHQYLFFGEERLVSFHYHSYSHGGADANAEYAISDEQSKLIYAPYREAYARALERMALFGFR